MEPPRRHQFILVYKSPFFTYMFEEGTQLGQTSQDCAQFSHWPQVHRFLRTAIASDKLATNVEVPTAPLRLDNLLEWLTEFRKAQYLWLQFYIAKTKQKKKIRTRPKRASEMKVLSSSGMQGPTGTPTCDNMQNMASQGSLLELHVQNFHWGFIMYTGLIELLAMWLNTVSSLFPPEVGLSHESKPQPSNHRAWSSWLARPLLCHLISISHQVGLQGSIMSNKDTPITQKTQKV